MIFNKQIKLLLSVIFLYLPAHSISAIAQEGSMSDAYIFLKATKDRDYSKVKNYLQRGVNVNTRSYNDGETALYIAATLKDTTLTTFLLNENAKTDIPVKSTGETPLMAAVRLKSKKIVEMLISQRADLDIGDRNGETALYKAVQSNNRESVKLLLAANADWSIADNTGRTPLDLVLENRRLRSISRLLEDAGAEY